ncbi:MAG: flagellar hook-basal body complex protein [Rhodospirillaceae bacterium]
MTIEGAIGSGLNGMTAFSNQVASISENLANVGTVGFKRVDRGFKDLMMGPSPSYKAPVSVRAIPIYRNNVTGTISGSDNPTSFAVSGGEGFVPVTETTFSGTTESLGTDTRFTRAADFQVDANYYMVNSQGQALMAIQETEKFSGIFTDTPSAGGLVAVNRDPAVYGTLPGTPTTSLSINVNFPATAPVVPTDWSQVAVPWPTTATTASGPLCNPPSDPSDQTLSLSYFNETGQPCTLEYTMRKTWAAGDTITDQTGTPVPGPNGDLISNSNTWTMIEGKSTNSVTHDVQYWTPRTDTAPTGLAFTSDPRYPAAPGPFPRTLSFGTDGKLLADQGTLDITWPQTMTLGFGNPAMDSTQFSGAAIEIRGIRDADGHADGNFSSASVNKDGYVVFKYTNGVSVTPYRIPLATFPRPELLERITGATFGANPKGAGDPTYSWPGDAGNGGTIAPNAKESSNVDVATELTKLITAQRAYSSNSKVISTGDQMIETAIGMKT